MSEFYFFSTPLHDAIRNNNFDKVSDFLNQNHDLDIIDEDNMNPLDLAKYLEFDSLVALIENKIYRNAISITIEKT
jgi:ankyrin repeat protein|uniref:Uncharacterized protein n=1 Tax=viral metagenome TaxID=1070528 RepID=A0A6C0J6Q3_9ZZZZ